MKKRAKRRGTPSKKNSTPSRERKSQAGVDDFCEPTQRAFMRAMWGKCSMRIMRLWGR
jgi:hypothetical protein